MNVSKNIYCHQRHLATICFFKPIVCLIIWIITNNIMDWPRKMIMLLWNLFEMLKEWVCDGSIREWIGGVLNLGSSIWIFGGCFIFCKGNRLVMWSYMCVSVSIFLCIVSNPFNFRKININTMSLDITLPFYFLIWHNTIKMFWCLIKDHALKTWGGGVVEV